MGSAFGVVEVFDCAEGVQVHVVVLPKQLLTLRRGVPQGVVSHY